MALRLEVLELSAFVKLIKESEIVSVTDHSVLIDAIASTYYI